MSDHQGFLKEKKQIDELLQSGYRIRAVKETLEGDFVELERHLEKKELHLLTADARKYLGTIIVEEKRKNQNNSSKSEIYLEAGASGS